MNFQTAFVKVVDHEGGLSLNREDRGNWTSGEVGKGQLKGTKYGISAMAYPNEDIAGLTLDSARAIYRRDYWDKVRGDELPDAVRFDIFDAAVNSGVDRAIRWLQMAAGVDVDGRIGPKTLAAARAIDPHKLSKRYNGIRLRFMTDTATWPTFSRGWARRIAANLLE